MADLGGCDFVYFIQDDYSALRLLDVVVRGS
jgi:hypothetical protein